MKQWKFVGINFDHMHMGDLLRQVHEHPEAEIAGVCDEDPRAWSRLSETSTFRASASSPTTAPVSSSSRPDIAILCPATAEHADCG